VEAGAGTGKTRALVDRVVALILDGRPVDRIVAITFTEKAAAELKDRVRAGLEESLSRDPGDQSQVRAALSALDRAQISTMHCFCQSLLRSFAAEAGIDPAFDVQDEVRADRWLEERWRTYLEELAIDAGAVAAFDRVLGLGLSTRDSETLVRELTSRAHLVPRLVANPLTGSAVVWPNIDSVRRELNALRSDGVPEDDKLRQRVEELLALVESLAGAGGEREPVLAAATALLNRGSKVGRAAAWGGKAVIADVRETVGGICEQLRDTLAACRGQALAALMPFIVRFVGEDAVARGREGSLTFDDLILRVRDLLAADSGAREALRERYDALLIDEFQDTDPSQVDIALAFATSPESGAMDPGRLFLVGDPKQSIYRFRRADMAVYSRTRDRIRESGGRLPVLALNRRSRPVILEWANTVFDRLIGEGTVPSVQPPYRPIYPHRSDELKGPGVGWFGGALDKVKAREVRQREAADVAAQCRAVLHEGWEVADPDGSIRKARFRDIAILIPTRTILPPLERAMAAAGIPYRVEGGSLIFRTQEIRDLINCLAAIDDPADEVAIVGALRSPAFACSDVELARHKAAGGRFNYLEGSPDDREGVVADGLRTLAGFHAERHERSLAALLERFVAERGLVEIGILDQADRNSFRRMRFMVEQARSFESAGPESLRAFVSWLDRRSTEAALDHEGTGLDDDEDAVRVLTIHGAKGLEFPIVFLAGLGGRPTTNTPVYSDDPAGDRIAVSIGAKTRLARFELGPVAELHDLEEQHTLAEADRLLYVAATRARDHLVLSLYHSASKKNCGALRLIEAGAKEGAHPLPDAPAVENVVAAPFADLDVDPPEVASLDVFAEQRSAMVEAARRQRYTSATALGPQWKEEPSDESELDPQRKDETNDDTELGPQSKEEASDDSEPWARGRGGTRLGRAVHAALQSLALDADEGSIADISRAQTVAEAIPRRAEDVAGLVRRALRSDAAGRARAAPRALREVPFAFPSDGMIVEGFIDLLIETDDGVEIVDWKTDDIPSA
jgi:ATP-dependent helicase/nuclease subunit A